jgi:hypothetical protein
MSTTMVATPGPDAPAEPRMSAFARIAGVFFTPKAAFADVVKKPTWLAPVLLLMVIYMGLSVVLAQRVNWYEATKEQIAKNKFAAGRIDQLSDEEKDRIFTQGAQRGKVFRYVRGVIGWPLLLLFSSGLYFLAFRLLGGARVNYKTGFALTAFGHLPLGLKELIAIPVTLVKDPSLIDPDNFLASNPAAIIGSDLPLWQTVSLSFLDVFGLWVVILMAVAFSVADPRKVPLGKALGIAFGLFVFLLCFFTGLTWILS